MKQILLPPHIQLAEYRTEGLPKRYHGNKLIEALPTPLSDEGLYTSLELLPPFDDSSRSWDRHARLRELLSLTNIMVPLSAHIELARTLDSMMREGYVGRSAMSAEHMSIYHDIRADELASKYGKAFRQTYDTLTPKLSTALVGVSGMGKTTTVQRVLARYPRVIYHPEIDLYQIPWLHFEMPSDGKGVKSLLTGIIEVIAELIPNNTYFEDYVVKGRPSESALQSSVRRLLNKHCVGLLIPDEVQNAANSRKSDQMVMTELTTLANKSKAPILYIGTPKASKVLGLDLRQGRRSVGLGLGDWNPLSRYDIAYDDGQVRQVAGEWVVLMEGLWQYCWLEKPVELTKAMLDVFYECTQGIIDLAIKLFIVVQTRAIVDGVETLSEQLVRAVYKDQFKVIHPMIDAYSSGDKSALEKFEDLVLPDVCDVVEGIERRSRLRKGYAASTRPGHSAFTPRLTEAAKALGLPPDDAMALAQQVANDGTAKNMLDAAVQLAKKAQPVAKVSSGGKKKKGDKQSTNDSAPSYPGIEHRPDDMRNAIVAAAERGTSVIEQLLQMKMVLESEEVLCLD